MPQIVDLGCTTPGGPGKGAIEQILVIIGKLALPRHPQTNHKVDHMLPVSRVVFWIPEDIVIVRITVTIYVR